MKSIESLSPQRLMERALAFTHLGPENYVSNFIIQGPINKADRLISTIAGLYPYTNPMLAPNYAVIGGEPLRQSAASWNKRIAELQLPTRVRQSGLLDIPQISSAMTAWCASRGLPNVLLAFGTYRGTDQSFIQLFHVAGMTPEYALKQIQDRAYQRYAKLQ